MNCAQSRVSVVNWKFYSWCCSENSRRVAMYSPHNKHTDSVPFSLNTGYKFSTWVCPWHGGYNPVTWADLEIALLSWITTHGYFSSTSVDNADFFLPPWAMMLFIKQKAVLYENLPTAVLVNIPPDCLLKLQNVISILLAGLWHLPRWLNGI